ncbi:alpha-tubulin N-acetyltransferase-like isoform X1 [Bradysia coprophila]|uniref:alpha-tubulin N-acetyltransferase-like isoform X1 n=1 Tax=Bradysia coprophila TaxID=38358 RepID=UPI00187D9A49|nr:alpha-tubulin N-acetyltransferase-like isoform X1 [Bradysia coprophila]XP_037047491.1 alpha-tubulin N-acetyltransferase-like isoform X1 [Bradysia coprophila]
MEFRFNLAPLFKTDIIKVDNNLVPLGFHGDRRTILDTTSKITEIINEMGESSARAQGLTRAVTTAQKLRNSDQVVYLLRENIGKNGAVTGLLKVGTKNLYVFDPNGETKQVSAPCVLDFYVHESRQRSGLGKQLFQTMLDSEGINPTKLAIDRPSEKLVGFLKKHYGLERTIPQMNNFVVYEGFFSASQLPQQLDDRRLNITASPNTALFGPHFISDESAKRNIRSKTSSPCLPAIQNAPIGRFGAGRPTCSMNQIIHNTPSTTAMASEPNSPRVDYIIHHDDYVDDDLICHHNMDEKIQVEIEEKLDEMIQNVNNIDLNIEPVREKEFKEVKFEEQVNVKEFVEPIHIKKPNHFPLSKQHTGLKNISYNVGAAVSPTDKMEFDQEEPESFGVLKINRPIGKTLQVDNTDAVSTLSNGSEGLTDQGYFDLKFYHNKLW